MQSLLILSLLVYKSICDAQIIYVNEASKTNGDGKSWSTAFQDLQSALKISTAGSSIWIAQGTYYPTTFKSNRNATFLIFHPLKLYGGFLGTETTTDQRPNPLAFTVLSGNIGDTSLSTDNSYHIITFTTDSSLLDGLIIADGYATDDTHSNDPSCSTCFGGGIWMPCDSRRPVQLTINECTFKSNTALSGGAIFAMCQAAFDITNSKFMENKAVFGMHKGGYGGSAMFAYMGNVRVSNTTFTNNIADGSGGAVHCDYGMECVFRHCTFEGNTANKGNGGAISMIDRDSQRGFSSLMVTQSVFMNNTAGAGLGGAIFLFDNNAHGVVNESKFISNTANQGGAMSFYGQSHCPGCCQPKSQNMFNDNSANDPQTDDCFMNTFVIYSSAPVTQNPLKYLQILYNQRNTMQPKSIPSASDTIVYVNKAAASGGDGTSWTKAFNDLQSGLDSTEYLLQSNAKSTVEIWVAGSADYATNRYFPQKVPIWYNTSAPYYDAQKSKLFEIPANVRLFGGFAGMESSRDQRNWYKYPTLLDGFVSAKEQVYQVVYVRENVWIDGFMISNGYGAIKQPPSSTINNAGDTDPDQVLYDKTPVRGAGIFSNVTAFVSANVLFYSHYSTKGSGLYVLGNPNFTHNITGYNLGFVNNYALERGGALAVDLYGQMNCIGCVFMNNVCSHKGGAVYSDFWSHNVLDECVFYNNTAFDSGGAVGMDAGHAKVINCNFTTNKAFSQGGAMYTGSYNPWGGGDSSQPNYYIVANNTMDENRCDSGLDDHYLWTYDYWIETQ
eukprot:603045_1